MKEPKGYLTLDSREGVMKGGTLGPALVPGKPADSKLIHAMKYADPHLQMPPSGKLADEVIADFEMWIAGGAPDPRVDTAAAATAKRRVVDEAELAKGRQWWAFQAVKVLPQPVSAHASTARTKLDHFVYAKLAEKGLTPSPQADDRTLVRRAYIDLIGLKPTYEEVEAYANDASPDKYEKLLDALLAMPQYGERWGRHWLDVVRYGEDNPGNITNPPYPHAWRYRDWVIEAINKDVPYDRFVKLQLAADLMPGTSRPDMRALGPIALGPQDHKDVRLSIDVIGTLQLNDWDERLDTMTRGLLGLSVSCARCHDHKFDPIRQMDYARLTSVFASTSRALRPFFEIDPKTETRFMWVYQRMFDLHYTANLLEGDPGSKPEQAERQVKTFRQELEGAAGRDRRDVEGVPADRASTSRPSRIRASGRPNSATRTARSRSASRCPMRSARARSIRFRIPSACRTRGRRRTAQADRSAGAVPEFDLRRGRVVEHVGARSHVLRRHAGQAARSAAVSRRQSRHADRSRAARVPARARERRRQFQQRIRPARARRENLHRRRAAERARDGESRVGLAFRQASRRHAQRFRHPGAAADASRIAGGSVRALHRERVVAQVAAPARSCCRPPIGSRASRARARWTPIRRTS